MSKLNVTAAELRALAGRAREIGTLEPFTDVALQWTGLAEKEIYRLRAERDELRRQLADMRAALAQYGIVDRQEDAPGLGTFVPDWGTQKVLDS